jgi:DNA polymerase-3 subunit delta'
MISTAADAGFRSIGQPVARRVVQQAAERGLLGRAFLVHGPPGADKDAFVNDLLALAFCAADPGVERPCNACRGCRDARARSHPDLVIGSPERWREGRSTGESIVGAARRWLLAAAGAPVVADRRIVLIEHADGANEQAQNALLKVLEEPTGRHTFVLVADEPARLLPTIRSRCQPLRIGPVARAELTDHLVGVMRMPHDFADAIARISGGLAGTAVAFARDDDERLAWRRRTQAELLALLERGRGDRLAAVRDLIDGAAGFVSAVPVASDDEGVRTPASVQREAALLVVDCWIGLTRDLLVARAGRPDLAPGTELGDGIPEAAAGLEIDALVRMAETLERVHAGLRENAAPRLSLEVAMLAWPLPAARSGLRL